MNPWGRRCQGTAGTCLAVPGNNGDLHIMPGNSKECPAVPFQLLGTA